MNFLPIGKLPPEIADELTKQAPILDSQIFIGPGPGNDCAVIDNGDNYLVLKTDPVTFITNDIGKYAVHINVNDIVTTGAVPKWMLATILLPEEKTDLNLIKMISSQIFDTCKYMEISFIGGHTEVTAGLHRPIISATLIGEVEKNKLLSPRNVKNNDHILLTKCIAIEATSILANEFEAELSDVLSNEELAIAKNYASNPGISVAKEARLVSSIQGVHAMHDPTEGGLLAALWELAIASQKAIQFYLKKVKISALTEKICHHFQLEELEIISSGALLIVASSESSETIIRLLQENGIACSQIGKIEDGNIEVYSKSEEGKIVIPRPKKDAITCLFQNQ